MAKTMRSHLRRIQALKPGESHWIMLLDTFAHSGGEGGGDESLRVEVMRCWTSGKPSYEVRLDQYDGLEWSMYEFGEFKACWFTSDLQEVENALGCYMHLADAVRVEIPAAQESDPVLKVAA